MERGMWVLCGTGRYEFRRLGGCVWGGVRPYTLHLPITEDFSYPYSLATHQIYTHILPNWDGYGAKPV